MNTRSLLRGALAVALVSALFAQAQPPIPAAQKIVQLPPVVVEALNGKAVRWRYAELPGFVVLSCCEDSTTERFITRVYRQSEAIRQFIPERFLLTTSSPTTYILYEQSLAKMMAAEMTQVMDRAGGSVAKNGVTPLPHLRLDDPDSSASYVILKDAPIAPNRIPPRPGQYWDSPRPGTIAPDDAESNDPYSRIALSDDYLRSLIESKGPAMPDWFTIGLVKLYSADLIRDREVAFGPDSWLSPTADEALRQNLSAPRPLLKMEELLVANAPRDRGEDYRRIWEAQAELFVRWALCGSSEGRDAFWHFADLCAREPVTEAVFTRCLGLDYLDARDALSDLLPFAAGTAVRWAVPPLRRVPRLSIRDATEAEVRRIRGDWTRRSLKIVRGSFPELAPAYASQARTAFLRAYDSGDRDPRLIAAMGLLEFDTGDLNGARARFEQVRAAHGVLQPYALAELTRIRLDEALTHPGGPNGTLGQSQMDSVLGPVDDARRLQPALRETYLLAARACNHLARNLTPHEREILNEGAWLFARESGLVLEAALWDARSGDRAQARQLADLGLYYASEPEWRQKFAALIESLSHAIPAKAGH
jgi:hypothetical protein